MKKGFILATILLAMASSAIAQKFPFQNINLPIEERVSDLISRLTLDEKLGFMEHQNQPVERLGIPAYSWWNEALHGVARNGNATVYPMPIAMASSFNPKLVEQVYSQIALEGIRKHQEMMRENRHEDYCGLTFFTPNINIFRDPRWGRGMETFGEDPYLTGLMGRAVVEGLQGKTKGQILTGACVKHLAVHSGPEGLRHEWNSQITMRDLWTTYLPAFEYVITNTDVQQVMCGYNRFNGEPCCANGMLNDILRNQWHYDNILVSDCWALNDMWEPDTVIPRHKTHPTAASAAAAAFGTEVDLECGSGLPALKEAVEKGLIPESKIDEHLRRILRTRLTVELNEYRNQIPYKPNASILSEITRQSMVLLKNQILPLSNDTKRVAVIGSNATDSVMQWGNYNGTPYHTATILDGMRKEAAQHKWNIYHDTAFYLVADDYKIPADFWKQISNCDVVVMCGGLSPALEGEELQVELPGFHKGDRTVIELPEVQRRMIHEIKKRTNKPIVLVLSTGSAIALKDVEPDLSAILVSWYGGELMGQVVADIIANDCSELGRLPVTFYSSTDQMPEYGDYNMQNRTYRYMEQKPLYPFGFGLTSPGVEGVLNQVAFDEKKNAVSGMLLSHSKTRSMKHESHVVQIYVRDIDDPKAPKLNLVGFSRISLANNMASKFTILLVKNAFYSYDEDLQQMRDMGHHFEIYAGFSSDMDDLTLVGRR